MNSFFWTLSIVLFSVGGIVVALSLMGRSYADRVQRYSWKATATVVEIEADTPDKIGRAKGIHDYYYAVFAYYAEGRLYKKRYERGGNPCAFSLNQAVDIQYDIEKPERFRLREKHFIEEHCRIAGGGEGKECFSKEKRIVSLFEKFQKFLCVTVCSKVFQTWFHAFQYFR